MLYRKLNYHTVGEGDNVVVFLHGWGGSTKSFEKVANRLSNCKCYLIDLYGFGKTALTKPMDTYEYAIMLYLFFVEQKLDNFTIVGHSFGGRLAILLSTLFNLNIKNIVLVDSAGLKPRFNLITYFKIKHYKFIKWLAKFKLVKSDKLQKFGSADYQNASNTLKITLINVVNQHLDYLINKIKTPTLIVWGTKDKETPLYMAQKLNLTIADSGVVFYRNSGHFSYLENMSNFIQVLNLYVRG